MVLIWLSPARKRLREIANYYLREKHTLAGHRIVKEITNAAHSLKTFPEMGTVETTLVDSPKTYRYLVVRNNYKIIYRIDNKKIYIVTIWDCRQNPDKLRKEIR